MTGRSPVLLLTPQDNVLVAVADLEPGCLVTEGEEELVVRQAVPIGHKLARRAIPAGARVIKYGAPIGSALCDIAAGDWVHMHNLASDYLATPGADRAA